MRHSMSFLFLFLLAAVLSSSTSAFAEANEFDLEIPPEGSSGPAYAPGPEFRLGVGAAPAPSIIEVFSDVWALTMSLGSLSVETESNDLTLFAEYAHPLSRRTGLVAHFGYASYDKTYTVRSSGEVLGKVTNRYYTLLAGPRLYYALLDSFGLYGEFLLGFSQNDATTDTDALGTDGATHFGYQITPLGLRLGRDLAVDLSVGFGYKGVFMASVDYVF